MRTVFILIIFVLGMIAKSTLLDVYTSGCPTGAVAFTADVTGGRCYTIPSSGTCNNNVGCADVPTVADRDLANLIRVANCTNFGNSFILGDGNIRYFGSANCTGIESSGPLNNPCLSVNLCNATSIGTGPFRSQSSAAADIMAALFYA